MILKAMTMFAKQFWFVLLGLVLFSSQTQASQTRYERVNYATASYEEAVEDLRVKIQGGYLVFDRTYLQVKLTPRYANSSDTYVGVSGARGDYSGSNTERESSPPLASGGSGRGGGGVAAVPSRPKKNDYGVWVFNRNWGDLVFLNQNLNTVSDGSSAFSIDRNDFIYKRKNGGAYYEYQHNGANLRITRTPNGYQWTNRRGDYINYDASGRATAYGNKNQIGASFERNSEGLIQHIKDHTGRTVASWTYDGKRPTQIEDYSGRRVLYRWSGNNLVGVTTVRGDQWRYDYDTIGGNRVMVSKTDPEDQTFLYRYRMTRGGFQSARAGGSRPPTVIGDTGVGVRSGSSGGGRVSRGGSYAVQAMLVLTEKVYPDGKKRRYQFFYEQDTKTYIMVELDSDGYERERWFDLDGEVKQELKGGLLASRRVRSGRRAVEIDAYGNTTVTEYDRWEAVKSVTFADGTKLGLDYLAGYNFPTEITDELGVKVTIEYDSRGNPTRVIRGAGTDDTRISQYEYDEFGNMTIERVFGDATSPNVETRHTYDDFGNRTSSRDARGNTMVYREFNALGQPAEMVDRRGNVWKASYDAAGNMVSSTTALEYVSLYQYDGLNRLIRAVDAELRQATYEYDSRDNLIREINNDDQAIENTFRMDGQILTTRDESGQLYTARYDRSGRLIQNIDGAGNTMSFRYERGDELAGLRLQNAVFPNNQVFYTYDKRGRQVRQRVASLDNTLADVTNIVFNARGEQIEMIDGNGNSTKMRYNVHGDVIAETNAEGETITMQYDRRGNLIAVTDAEQRTTQYRYDANNNNVSEAKPLGELFTFEFDANDNLVRQIDPKGNIAQFAFDEDDRPIGESNSLPGAAEPERSVTYSFDKTNLLKSYSDNHSSAIYNYDSLGRLIGQNINFGSFNKTLNTTYKANGQMASRVDAEGVSYAFSYDAAGKLKQLAIPNEGSILVNNHQGYLPTSISFPGGTTQTLQYDGLGRIQRIQVQDAADTTLMDHRYTRDVIGNILKKTTQAGEVNYQYDKTYRLVNASQPNNVNTKAYTYDNNGNRTQLNDAGVSVNYAFNQNHELVLQQRAGVGTTYNYDRNGALVEEVTNGTTTKYNYNSFARLASVEFGAVDNFTQVAEYRYDPFGRRIAKILPDQTTYFLYDGENLVGEYDENGELLKGYIFQPNSDAGSTPIASKLIADNGGFVYQYHQNDHLDTPQLLTNRDGTIAWQGNYDAFGRVTNSGGNASNKIRFPGQYYDQETGLNYNWNRFYNPQTGRYISSDPIGLGGGPNTYTYALNNPLILTDPTGEIVPLILGAMISGALWGAGIDIAIQLLTNGGRFDCLNWNQVMSSALWGAAFGGVLGALFRAAAIVSRAVSSGVGKLLGRSSRGLGAGAGRAGAGALKCFVKGTLVETSEGLKAIEEIKIGDLVAAKKSVDGKVEFKPVVRLFRNKNMSIFRVSFKVDGEDLETLGVTAEHPFWVTNKGWVNAKDLSVGSQISTMSGSVAVVTSINNNGEKQDTYNFEVKDYHTYFVSKLGLWTHNMCALGQLFVRPWKARSQLRKALGTAGTGLRAHHLIPWQMRTHPLVQRAAAGGFKINGANNGIALSAARHPSSHLRYNNAVRSMLDDIWANNPNISSGAAAKAVQSYANTLSRGISRSSRTLTPRSGRTPTGVTGGRSGRSSIIRP